MRCDNGTDTFNMLSQELADKVQVMSAEGGLQVTTCHMHKQTTSGRKVQGYATI